MLDLSRYGWHTPFDIRHYRAIFPSIENVAVLPRSSAKNFTASGLVHLFRLPPNPFRLRARSYL
jgi:hypothetical protein